MKEGMSRHFVLCLLGALGLGCSARPGMFCQTDGDCRSGLVCVRPPADAASSDGGAFGVCEAARLGLGEVCLWSSECQAPLLCGNTLGDFIGDGRHGRCVQGPSNADQSAAADAAVLDLGDGGAGDGPPDASPNG